MPAWHKNWQNMAMQPKKGKLHAASSLIWGGGEGGISVPFYSVQDCRYILYLGVKCTILKKLIQFKDCRKFSFFSKHKSVRLCMLSRSKNEHVEGRESTFHANGLCG